LLSDVTAAQLATLFSDVATLLGAIFDNKVDTSHYESVDVGILKFRWIFCKNCI